jgi:hypothetical protein
MAAHLANLHIEHDDCLGVLLKRRFYMPPPLFF